MDNFFKITKCILSNSNLWISAIVITYLGYLFFKSEDKEDFLIFKIIGFYMLGLFTFSFNIYDKHSIVIPIGFIVYLISMKNKERLNRNTKRKASIFGFVVLCITFLSSYMYDLIEYRDLSIDSIGLTKETIKEDWDNISKRLQIDRYLVVDEFRLTYNTEDNVEHLYYMISDSERRCNIDYRIEPNKKNAMIKVIVDKINNDKFQELEYFNEYEHNANIDINRFMEIIDNLKFKQEKIIDGKNVDKYTVLYRANDYMVDEWSTAEGGSVFRVDTQNNYKYDKVKQRYLPAQGPNIAVFPMESLSEGSESSIYADYYMIDSVFNTDLIRYEAENIELICDNHNVKKTTMDDNIDKYEILDTLDFSSWEEEKALDIEFIESKTKSPIIIKDINGAIISLYEDMPYAKYKSESETVLFDIPKNIYSEIEYLID